DAAVVVVVEVVVADLHAGRRALRVAEAGGILAVSEVVAVVVDAVAADLLLRGARGATGAAATGRPRRSPATRRARRSAATRAARGAAAPRRPRRSPAT